MRSRLDAAQLVGVALLIAAVQPLVDSTGLDDSSHHQALSRSTFSDSVPAPPFDTTAEKRHRLQWSRPDEPTPRNALSRVSQSGNNSDGADVHEVYIYSGDIKQVVTFGADTAQWQEADETTPAAGNPPGVVRCYSDDTLADTLRKTVWTVKNAALHLLPVNRLVAKAEPKQEKHCRIPTGLMQRNHDVSAAFACEIAGALSTLPESCLQALGKSGYRVILSRTLADVMPGARDQQVRGYEPRVTWKSVYGMFNRTTHRVTMAELAEQSSQNGQSVIRPLSDHDRRLGIVKHEFGHAVDQYLGNYSHSREFMRVYSNDSQSFSTEERRIVSYFLQPSYAGAEETFAELFACINGASCDPGEDFLLEQHFGDLEDMIRARVKTIR